MARGGKPSRKSRAALAAILPLALLDLPACASASQGESPTAAQAAAPKFQQPVRRASRGDRTKALWPRNFGEIRSFRPSSVATVLRLCGLEPRPGGEPDCPSEQEALLRSLAQFETNFRTCRIRTNLGNAAGTGPHSFIFNAIDTGRRIETRRCMLDEAIPARITRDQSRLIWSMWLALGRADREDWGPGSRDEIRRQFTAELATYREDSLLWFAMRDALGRNPSPEDQVGDSWWWHLCRLASPAEPQITATDAETKICAMVAALAKKE